MQSYPPFALFAFSNVERPHLKSKANEATLVHLDGLVSTRLQRCFKTDYDWLVRVREHVHPSQLLVHAEDRSEAKCHVGGVDERIVEERRGEGEEGKGV